MGRPPSSSNIMTSSSQQKQHPGGDGGGTRKRGRPPKNRSTVATGVTITTAKTKPTMTATPTIKSIKTTTKSTISTTSTTSTISTPATAARTVSSTITSTAGDTEVPARKPLSSPSSLSLLLSSSPLRLKVTAKATVLTPPPLSSSLKTSSPSSSSSRKPNHSSKNHNHNINNTNNTNNNLPFQLQPDRSAITACRRGSTGSSNTNSNGQRCRNTASAVPVTTSSTTSNSVTGPADSNFDNRSQHEQVHQLQQQNQQYPRRYPRVGGYFQIKELPPISTLAIQSSSSVNDCDIHANEEKGDSKTSNRPNSFQSINNNDNNNNNNNKNNLDAHHTSHSKANSSNNCIDHNSRKNNHISHYKTDRPKPLAMSKDVPFRTHEEVENMTLQCAAVACDPNHWNNTSHDHCLITNEESPPSTRTEPTLLSSPPPNENFHKNGSTSRAGDYFSHLSTTTTKVVTSSVETSTITVTNDNNCNETNNSVLRLIHKPMISSQSEAIAPIDFSPSRGDSNKRKNKHCMDLVFTTYSQLGNPKPPDWNNNVIMSATCNNTTSLNDATGASPSSPPSLYFSPTVSFMEWMQKMRTWYSNVVVAQDFPVTQPGTRSTKSRYKKQRTMENNNFKTNKHNDNVDGTQIGENSNLSIADAFANPNNHLHQHKRLPPLPLQLPTAALYHHHYREGNNYNLSSNSNCNGGNSDRISESSSCTISKQQRQPHLYQPHPQPDQRAVLLPNPPLSNVTATDVNINKKKKRKTSLSPIAHTSTSLTTEYSSHTSTMSYQGSDVALEYKLQQTQQSNHYHHLISDTYSNNRSKHNNNSIENTFEKVSLACLLQWNYGQIGYATFRELHRCRLKQASNNNNSDNTNNNNNNRSEIRRRYSSINSSIPAISSTTATATNVISPNTSSSYNNNDICNNSNISFGGTSSNAKCYSNTKCSDDNTAKLGPDVRISFRKSDATTVSRTSFSWKEESLRPIPLFGDYRSPKPGDRYLQLSKSRKRTLLETGFLKDKNNKNYDDYDDNGKNGKNGIVDVTTEHIGSNSGSLKQQQLDEQKSVAPLRRTLAKATSLANGCDKKSKVYGRTNGPVVVVSYHHQQELNKTWKAVRSCAIAMRNQLRSSNINNSNNNANSTGTKAASTTDSGNNIDSSSNPPAIYLSSLVHFLAQVARMPPPTNTNTPNCISNTSSYSTSLSKNNSVECNQNDNNNSNNCNNIKDNNNISDTRHNYDKNRSSCGGGGGGRTIHPIQLGQGSNINKINNFCTISTSSNGCTTEESTDTILQELSDISLKTRGVFAKLLDAWGSDDGSGIDIDILRKTLCNAEKEAAPLILDFSSEMHRQLNDAVEWQNKVELIMKELESSTDRTIDINSTNKCSHDTNSNLECTPRNDLLVLERLYEEGTSLTGFRSKGLIALEAKILKGQQLRERILNWKRETTTPTSHVIDSSDCGSGVGNNGKKETMKFVMAIVREINRTKLRFPEVTGLLQFHTKAEAWVDRASIAIRSRMSLDEIKSLVETGRNEIMPYVDVSEFMEKLEARVEMADDWIERFHKALASSAQSNNNDESNYGKDDGNDSDSSTEVDPVALEQVRLLSSLEKLKRIRKDLFDKVNSCVLHELASEGSRIPVDVEGMKLLQLELDARGWSSKAKKWLPNPISAIDTITGELCSANSSNNNKRVGKLEEIREHLNKANSFRDRLGGFTSLSRTDCDQWVLTGERELSMLVQSADSWLRQHQRFLDIDGRYKNGNNFTNNNMGKSTFENGKSNSIRITLNELRKIVADGNAMHVNIGTPMTKITRILTQAENWYKTYESILLRCHITKLPHSNRKDEEMFLECNGRDNKNIPLVKVSDLKEAIESASTEVSVDLEEAIQLELLLKRVQDWQDRASMGMPTESTASTLEKGTATSRRRSSGKGHNNMKKTVPTLELTGDELCRLIEEAEIQLSPIDLKETLVVLQAQLDSMKGWHDSVAMDLEAISVAFRQLRQSLLESYGDAGKFEREKGVATQALSLSCAHHDTNPKSSYDNDEEDEGVSVHATTSENHTVCSSLPTITRSSTKRKKKGAPSELSILCQNVRELIKAFDTRSNSNCVATPERTLATQLIAVSDWCVRSNQILEKQEDIFDKRCFAVFDKLLLDGRSLLEQQHTTPSYATPLRDSGHLKFQVRCNFAELESQWIAVIKDQLERLDALAGYRKRFITFCAKAESMLLDVNKKLTLEKLAELDSQCNQFPSSCSVVLRNVRKLYSNAIKWVTKARKALDDASSNASDKKKLSLDVAKSLVTEGEKLGVQCAELRVLRNAIKSAKSWSNRIKKLGLHADLGNGSSDKNISTSNVKEMKALLEEYDTMIIDMNEEAATLRSASKNYCLCRRPFEGFMIGCDTCDEWFHGPCIGVTESKADKVNEYVCVRCCLEKSFRNSCSVVLDVIRKWTSQTDLKKARKISSQKHQRKVRKETKDLERFRYELGLLQQRLSATTDGDVHQQDITTHQSIVFNVDQLSVDPKLTMNEAFNTPDILVTAENTPSSDCASLDGDTSKDFVIPAHLTLDEIVTRIAVTEASITRCLKKIETLAKIGVERLREESIENMKADILQKWCVRVRSLVLVPSSNQLAKLSQPKCGDMLSEGMLTVLQDANRFGLSELEDVKKVRNAFCYICWYFNARSMLRKQATSANLAFLLDQASAIAIPDGKALRTLKGLLARSSTWETKVEKVLTPIPGETKPYCMETLLELSAAGDDIPLYMSMEARLLTVIEDNGSRHCICGGPSDGRFMVACENCDNWYHGHCVNVSRNTSEDDLIGWKCPVCCTGSNPAISDPSILNLDKFHELFNMDNDVGTDPATMTITASIEKTNDPISSYLCDLSNEGSNVLWPPYGFFGSKDATEALGEECCALEDDVEEWTLPSPTVDLMSVAGNTVSPLHHMKNSPTSSPSVQKRSTMQKARQTIDKSKIKKPLASPKRPSAKRPRLSKLSSQAIPTISVSSNPCLSYNELQTVSVDSLSLPSVDCVTSISTPDLQSSQEICPTSRNEDKSTPTPITTNPGTSIVAAQMIVPDASLSSSSLYEFTVIGNGIIDTSSLSKQHQQGTDPALLSNYICNSTNHSGTNPNLLCNSPLPKFEGNVTFSGDDILSEIETLAVDKRSTTHSNEYESLLPTYNLHINSSSQPPVCMQDIYAAPITGIVMDDPIDFMCQNSALPVNSCNERCNSSNDLETTSLLTLPPSESMMTLPPNESMTLPPSESIKIVIINSDTFVSHPSSNVQLEDDMLPATSQLASGTYMMSETHALSVGSRTYTTATATTETSSNKL